MKRILILTLVLVMLALPASAMLRILDPDVALELETIARNSVAAERNIPLAGVTAVDPWLMDLRGLGIDIYVVPLVIGAEKVTVYVRVSDKAILTTAEAEALKAEEVATATKYNRIATAMSLTAPEAITDTALPVAAGTSTLTYALYGGFAALALGAGFVVLRKKIR